MHALHFIHSPLPGKFERDMVSPVSWWWRGMAMKSKYVQRESEKKDEKPCGLSRQLQTVRF